MSERFIQQTIENNKDNIIMLDAILQWSMNPTSMSAGYGIKENYSHIENNLKETYELSSTEIQNVMDNLRKFNKELKKFIDDKYSIYNFQDQVKDQLSRKENLEIFKGFIQNRLKKSNQDTKNFVELYKNCPVRNFNCLNIQFNALYGKDFNEEGLIRSGILKPLYWISSGRSGKKEVIPKYIPFLNQIIDDLDYGFYYRLKQVLGLAKWEPDKPDIQGFLKELIENHDYNILNFLMGLYERDEICTWIYDENLKIKQRNGIIGIYQSPHSGEIKAGISFLIKKNLFNLIKEYIKEDIKQKTEKVIKILEYEKSKDESPTEKEMIREFNLYIDEIEEYQKLINEIPSESFSGDEEIIRKASKAIMEFDNPSLYDLLKTCKYDIITARKVGKYLLDKNMIDRFVKVSKETSPIKPMKIESESKLSEKIKCPHCETSFHKRDLQEFCQYCGGKL